MEYVDVFDANYNHLGKERKHKVYSDGLWHQAFYCWIIRPNNKILLQLRSKDKSHFPNKVDASAAGTISAGETVLTGGIREIKEELGINVDEKRLRYLGFFQQAADLPTQKGLFYIRGLSHAYFLKDDTPLDKYILQEREVDGIYEMDIQDGLKLFSDEVKEISITGIARESGLLDTINVSKDRFVMDACRTEFYYIKLCIMAERFAKGEKYLAF